MKKNNIIPEAFPPGEFINDELGARGLRQKDLAFIMGESPTVINELIKGKRRITAKLAQELADAFGSKPEEWLSLQNQYDLAIAEYPEGEARKTRARLFQVAPLTDLIDRGWIVESSNVDFLEAQLHRFYRSEDLSDLNGLRMAARKSTDYSNLSKEQMAWFQRAYNIAETMPMKIKYSSNSFEKLYKEIYQLLSEPEEIRHVPVVLENYGIRFIVIQHLPGSKIDGVCFWLDKNSPVIALSMRYNRIDCFWYTLFHELAHVYYKDGLQNNQKINVDTSLVGNSAQTSGEKQIEEKRADKLAEKLLIHPDIINDFISRVSPTFSHSLIVNFAIENNVHPGIVIGRLHHLGKIPYSHGWKMLVKVRDLIIENALTDGWGVLMQT